MDYTKSIGNITELKCLIAFTQMGFDCSIPYGDCSKYDIIVDVGDELLKIQCKSSRHPIDNGVVNKDVIVFSCVSQTTNTKKTTRHTYKDKVDYFATTWKDKVYLIPVDECSTSKTLRLNPPVNKVEYNAAEDYEVNKILGHKINPKFLEDSEIKTNSESTIVKSKYNCPICGSPVSKNGVFCVKCAQFAARKVDRPSKEELKNLIKTNSFIQIGKQYGVSDNAVRKWCKEYGLPYKSREIKQISKEDWELL